MTLFQVIFSPTHAQILQCYYSLLTSTTTAYTTSYYYSRIVYFSFTECIRIYTLIMNILTIPSLRNKTELVSIKFPRDPLTPLPVGTDCSGTRSPSLTPDVKNKPTELLPQQLHSAPLHGKLLNKKRPAGLCKPAQKKKRQRVWSEQTESGTERKRLFNSLFFQFEHKAGFHGAAQSPAGLIQAEVRAERQGRERDSLTSLRVPEQQEEFNGFKIKGGAFKCLLSQLW